MAERERPGQAFEATGRSVSTESNVILMDVFYRNANIREDGCLVELYSEKDIGIKFTHSYLVTIKPGKIRAKHYHNKKTECIFLIRGKIKVFIVNLATKSISAVDLIEEETKLPYVVLNPGIPHAIKNIGSEDAMIVVFSSSYDLEDVIPYDFGELDG